jgi:pimeloyl-ACP methyl ester carboxylesterase
VVQGGPALPTQHEVARFQRLLNLEERFLVAYWEQRGCGVASRADAASASFPRQVEDLRTVLRWLQEETKQRVAMLGISIGATLSLLAAAQEPNRAKAIIAVSPDAHTAMSDAAAAAVLEEHGRRSSVVGKRVMKLAPPPYLDTAAFQQRARLLADLGMIESGRTFAQLMRDTLLAMARTYGPTGAIKAMRNMNIVQRKLLPEIARLDLFANPPRVAVPVHYVFGEQDALTPASVVAQLPASVAAPASTVTLVPDAGHNGAFRSTGRRAHDRREAVRIHAIQTGATIHALKSVVSRIPAISLSVLVRSSAARSRLRSAACESSPRDQGCHLITSISFSRTSPAEYCSSTI